MRSNPHSEKNSRLLFRLTAFKRKARAVNRDLKKRIVRAVSRNSKKRKPLSESRGLKRWDRQKCLSHLFLQRRHMESLRIYRIDDKYIRFLKSRDNRVQDNKGRRRPYVGVVLYVGDFRYFVPMESPKPNHANIKPGRHILKLDGGKLGLLGFNNMIPVNDAALIEFDIDSEPDRKYAELLRRQVTYINKNKANVLGHASSTYYNVVNKKNAFLLRICCDFKKLEYACVHYDPNR